MDDKYWYCVKHHAVEQTAETLRDLVRSRSKYLVAPEGRRREMDAVVAEIASRLPPRFELPYVTVAYRASRR